MRTIVLFTLTVFMLLPGAALTADDAPTLAFLRFGVAPYFSLTDSGVLDTLQVYGYLSEEERAQLDGGGDLRGENINILYRDAGFDYGNAALMVEDALDEGADVLITISNEVGLLAANAIAEMDDPPALIFAIVTSPYDIGIAESACVKPAYVGGTEMTIDWEIVYDMPFMQDPDLDTLGAIGDPADPGFGRTRYYLEEYAEDYEIAVEIVAAATASEMALAAEQLVSAGADMIYLAPRTSPTPGIPAVIEAAYGVPVASSIVTDIGDGVTIAGGFEGWYREGMSAARLAIGVMRDEIDLASTGIASTPAYVFGVNLQSADLQGVEISAEMLDIAKYVIGLDDKAEDVLQDVGLLEDLPDMSLEERMALDQAFLDSLHCTPEMIAEQQAMLDAQSEA